MKSGFIKKCNAVCRQRSGFTIVEIVVVLVILGILCVLTVPNALGWLDYTELKRQNGYAKTIYSAAQTRLTQYEVRGQLTALANLIDDDNEQPDGYGYYLMAQKGDYAQYQDLNLKGISGSDVDSLTDEDKNKKALFDLIDPGVTDKSLLDAAICIELDPTPRVVKVYAVFYSDQGDDTQFVYGPAGGLGEVSISDRSYEAGNAGLIGYYGQITDVP